MKRVSVHIDVDTMGGMLASGFTPSMFVQRITAAARAFGPPGGRRCHGDWSRYPASLREALEAEGWYCLDPLLSPAGWRSLKALIARDRQISPELTLLVVSGNRGLASRAAELREYASELLWWNEGNGVSATGWDRLDSLKRVLGVGGGDTAVIVDVNGLVGAVWPPEGVVNLDALLDRLRGALTSMGQTGPRIALADWHTLPVMRDASGDPITHEAEALFRKAGFATPTIPPLTSAELPEEVTTIATRLEPCESLVIVGRAEIALALGRIVAPKAARIHLWCDVAPTVPEWISTSLVEDVLAGGSTPRLPLADDDSLPSLWSRIGLLADRLVAESGADAVDAGDLLAAMTSLAPFVRKQEHALALVEGAVSKGVLRQVEVEGNVSYQINDENPHVSLMRDMLKALVEILGEGPGNGTGVPVDRVIDALLTQGCVQNRLKGRESILAWLNFFVDEGLLLRFKGPSERGDLVPCLAFAPLPVKRPAAPGPTPTGSRTQVRQRKTPVVRIPAGLREQVIMAVDTYAIRHGRAPAPISGVRRVLSEHGPAVIEAAVREGIRMGDLVAAKGAAGSVSVNPNSRFARVVVGRKNRAIFLLKQMAPMGQPIGESRIKNSFMESLNLKDDESADLLAYLLRERIVRREPQIMTSGGPSYTLSLEDPAVMKAHEHAMSRGGPRPRFGPEPPRDRSLAHPREKRRP